MKKLLTTLLVLLLLAGCGSTSTDSNNTNGTTDLTSDLLTSDKIIIGTSPDYPPFENLTTSGEIEGFDIDLMNALIEIINEDNQTNLTVEWKQLDFNSIIGALQSNQVDLGMSAFSYSEDRDVWFSNTYLTSAQVVLVKADSDITTTTDLNGKNIGVQSGTTGETEANKIDGANITSLNDANLLVAQLKTNAFDAIVLDSAVAKTYVENEGLVQLENALVDESLGIIANHSKDNLSTAINAAIDKFIVTDEYQSLLTKWGLQ